MTARGGGVGGSVCTEHQEYKRGRGLTYWKAKWWEEVGLGGPAQAVVLREIRTSSIYERHLGGAEREALQAPPPPVRPTAEEQAEGERRTFGSGRAPLDHRDRRSSENRTEGVHSIPDHGC